MTFLQVVFSEFKAIFSNVSVIFVVFVGSILYAFLYPTPYYADVVRKQKIVVIDKDNTKLSKDYIFLLNAANNLEVSYVVQSDKAAKELLEKNEVYGEINIPKGFESSINKGVPVTLLYRADASYFLIYGTIIEGLNSVGTQFSNDIKRARNAKLGKANIMQDELVRLDSIPLFNPSIGYINYALAAILVFILHQTLLAGVMILSATQNARFKRMDSIESSVIPKNLDSKNNSVILSVSKLKNENTDSIESKLTRHIERSVVPNLNKVDSKITESQLTDSIDSTESKVAITPPLRDTHADTPTFAKAPISDTPPFANSTTITPPFADDSTILSPPLQKTPLVTPPPLQEDSTTITPPFAGGLGGGNTTDSNNSQNLDSKKDSVMLNVAKHLKNENADSTESSTILSSSISNSANTESKPPYFYTAPIFSAISARIFCFSIIYVLLFLIYFGVFFKVYGINTTANSFEFWCFGLMFIMATSAFGVFLGTFITSSALPTQIILISSMPLVFMMGFIYPVMLLPEVLQVLIQIIPAYHGINGFLRLNQMGDTLGAIMPHFYALLIIFWTSFALSYYRIKKLHKKYRI